MKLFNEAFQAFEDFYYFPWFSFVCLYVCVCFLYQSTNLKSLKNLFEVLKWNLYEQTQKNTSFFFSFNTFYFVPWVVPSLLRQLNQILFHFHTKTYDNFLYVVYTCEKLKNNNQFSSSSSFSPPFCHRENTFFLFFFHLEKNQLLWKIFIRKNNSSSSSFFFSISSQFIFTTWWNDFDCLINLQRFLHFFIHFLQHKIDFLQIKILRNNINILNLYMKIIGDRASTIGKRNTKNRTKKYQWKNRNMKNSFSSSHAP